MTAASPLAPRRAAVAFVMVTVLLDMLAMAIIIPVLPRLVLDFSAGDTAAAAGAMGVFGTAWNLMQFVASPVVGALSDRFGRRPIILLSNLGLGLDYVLMALAPGLALLFVGRLISGITAASVSTAGAYIADVLPAERRAPASACSAPRSASASCLARRSAGCLAGLTRDCRSGWRPA